MIKGSGVDELVRHQSPVFAGKAGGAQEGRGGEIATAAGKVENPIGIARVVPLRRAVCGVGLSGDQDHRSSFSLFGALDLNLPGVAGEASYGVGPKKDANSGALTKGFGSPSTS